MPLNPENHRVKFSKGQSPSSVGLDALLHRVEERLWVCVALSAFK